MIHPITPGKAAALLLPIALLAGLHAPLRAQDTPRDLSGTVTDHASHEPLRGAVVQLQNESTQSIVSYLTDKHGHYEFKRIGADTDYTLWATYRGTRSKTHSLDKFSTKKAVVLNLVIKLP